MCGIAGHVGEPVAASVLIASLIAQRERGIDGFGYAALTGDDYGDVTRRRALQITKLDAELMSPAFIAHNRLPTHGVPAQRNCHPFIATCDGFGAVVHNGVVYNHTRLRLELEAEGHKFTSEVDSEVLAHLAESFTEDPEGLVEEVMTRAQGMITVAYLMPKIKSVVLMRNERGSACEWVESSKGFAFASSPRALPGGYDKRSKTLAPNSAKLFTLK